MVWVWVVIIVVVIGAVVVVAVGRDDAMADVYDDRPDAMLPTGRPLTADDLDAVRFSTAVRGYRMDEVDALLAHLKADLLAREQRGSEHADSHDGAPDPSHHRYARPSDPDPPPTGATEATDGDAS